MKDKYRNIYNRHKKILEDLKKHNNFYFKDDNPQISDAEYDKLKKEALNLEKKNPHLKTKRSVEKIIGAPPSNKFKKIKH